MVVISRVQTRYKAEKLVRDGKVSCEGRFTNRFRFKVSPLTEKNAEHIVTSNIGQTDWSCDCKAFATKKKGEVSPPCSHIMACRIWLALLNNKYKEGFLVETEGRDERRSEVIG